jgi:antitoxin Phd
LDEVMKNVAAAEAKNHFGHLLDMAQRTPVTIEKKGRPVAVVMSIDEYQRLEQLEDRAWANEALIAKSEGLISTDKSMQFLDDIE